MNADNQHSRWRSFMTYIRDAAELAKLFAFILVAVGALGFYLPSLGRFMASNISSPEEYYYVGHIGGAPDFDHIDGNHSYHPAWNYDKVLLEDFFAVAGDIIFNESKKPMAGRNNLGVEGSVINRMISQHECLLVKELYFRPYERKRSSRHPDGIKDEPLEPTGGGWPLAASKICGGR